MRRSTLFAAALVGAALALPGVAAAQVPRQDSVTGTGTARSGPLIYLTLDFEFDARSGPSGENPTGHVTFRNTGIPTIFLEGPVTCLVVNGSVATLNLQSGTAYGIFTVEVRDSASGDTIALWPTGREPGDCAPLDQRAGLAVIAGNVVVVDAPPLPTSRDQCKNGGWRDFPGFKNQGDCVSYVATGGKNEPNGP